MNDKSKKTEFKQVKKVSQNEDRLKEILTELEEIGDEIGNMIEVEDEVAYELSEIGSSLVDVREELREILK